MATNPKKPIGSKPENASIVIDEVTKSLRTTAEGLVPWFLEQMPLMYFQDTDKETQLAHLKAIIAARASERPLELTLRNEEGSQWTCMRPLDYPGVLAEIMEELPWDQTLRTAKIHTATDGNLVIDTFEFGEAEPFNPDDAESNKRVDEVIEYANENNLDWSRENVLEFFKTCSAEYVRTVTPLRMENVKIVLILLIPQDILILLM